MYTLKIRAIRVIRQICVTEFLNLHQLQIFHCVK